MATKEKLVIVSVLLLNYPLYPQVSTVYRVLLAKLPFFLAGQTRSKFVITISHVSLLAKHFRFIIGLIYFEV